jgi:hypothetical protein
MNGPKHIIEVATTAPESLNLLGLMMGSLIRRQLLVPSAARHARALRGQVAINAGGMLAVLDFEPDRISISSGAPARSPRASVSGSLVALLDAALGRRRLRHVLRGDLIAWGSPWALWHLLMLLKVTVADTKPSGAPG